MEHTVFKRDGKFYIHLLCAGEVLHETECHYDQREFFLTKYRSLYRLWLQEQHKAVLNRWATFDMVVKHMDFPWETGAHAAIFAMVNSHARS